MNASLQAHRVEIILTQDGTLTLDHLPFQAGEGVEVIVLPRTTAPINRYPLNRYPLRGMGIVYQGPIEPIAEHEWDAAR